MRVLKRHGLGEGASELGADFIVLPPRPAPEFMGKKAPLFSIAVINTSYNRKIQCSRATVKVPVAFMDFVNSILGRQPQQAPIPDEDSGRSHHTTREKL